MDGDGKDDVAFFTPSQKSTDDSSSSKKKRRDAEATDEEATCIVDGESQPCVGEIAVVSASVGTPIGVRSVFNCLNLMNCDRFNLHHIKLFGASFSQDTGDVPNFRN